MIDVASTGIATVDPYLRYNGILNGPGASETEYGVDLGVALLVSCENFDCEKMLLFSEKWVTVALKRSIWND